LKKALTLLELILTIVIFAIVLTVIPKIIYLANKSFQTSLKQDAVFGAVTIMGDSLKSVWDEQQFSNEDSGTYALIVDTIGSTTECNNTTSKRVGDFINGSRQCRGNTSSIATTPANLGQDSGNDFDDMDDYNGSSKQLDVNVSGTIITKYDLITTVTYMNENANFIVYDTSNQTATINLPSLSDINTTSSTNIKLLISKISYSAGYKDKGGQTVTQYYYMSPNIGLATISSIEN
jgi:hypothetical protein